MNDTTRSDDVRALGELLEDIDFCMLTTQDAAGELHSRPMSTQSFDFDGTLWFLTDRDSHKVADIDAVHDVLLTYADVKDQCYVAVRGSARVMRDDEMIDRLWSPAHRAWWPDGKRDPSILVLAVDVEHADTWTSPGSKLVQLVGFAKAAVGAGSGEDLGEQRSLDFVSGPGDRSTVPDHPG